MTRRNVARFPLYSKESVTRYDGCIQRAWSLSYGYSQPRFEFPTTIQCFQIPAKSLFDWFDTTAFAPFLSALILECERTAVWWPFNFLDCRSDVSQYVVTLLRSWKLALLEQLDDAGDLQGLSCNSS